ncbi:MAG: YceI family protein [Myxococcales bacterium]|nr:YceI family protein [Myxococcales bacterium]
MIQFTADDVRCRVHTRKQGILSKIAHDLCFSVDKLTGQWSLTAPGEVTVPVADLRLLGAEQGGEIVPFGRGDERRIIENLHRDVLHSHRFPAVRYRWTTVSQSPGQVRVDGALSLHGVTRPVRLLGRVSGEFAELSTELDQRDYGIKPFRAAMGALKVDPVVRVTVRLPAAWLSAD